MTDDFMWITDIYTESRGEEGKGREGKYWNKGSRNETNGGGHRSNETGKMDGAEMKAQFAQRKITWRLCCVCYRVCFGIMRACMHFNYVLDMNMFENHCCRFLGSAQSLLSTFTAWTRQKFDVLVESSPRQTQLHLSYWTGQGPVNTCRGLA